MKTFTDNVIFCLDDELDESDEEVSFYCGKSTEDGYFNDEYDAAFIDELTEILLEAGFNEDSLYIETSESFHIIELDEGQNSKDIWEKIRLALITAGAVEHDPLKVL